MPGAGDNVVRMLPPLNIADEEIAEATHRLSRALDPRLGRRKVTTQFSSRPERHGHQIANQPQPRHFLDLDALDAPTLRKILDMAHAMKKAGKKTPAKFKPPGIERRRWR